MLAPALILIAGAMFCVEAADPARLEAPFWRSRHMDRDTLFFIQEEGDAAATAHLLFIPRKTPVLMSATEEVQYELGRDFQWQEETMTIRLTQGSRIPFKKRSEMYPLKGSPNSIGPARGREGHNLFFGEGHAYHDLQVVASYDHADKWTGFVPPREPKHFPKTIEKIKQHAPISLVVLGDSISAGANASGMVGAKPGMPSYPGLVAKGLEGLGAGTVKLKNFSVGGQVSGWGASQVDKVLAEKPDLVVLAFGMNDAGGVPAAQFAANTQKMIDLIRAGQPDCEFVLVATMLGNSEWPVLKQELFPQFRDELKKMAGTGIDVADMTSLWADLLKRKKFYDLTGNGVNHPNDFGHRVYAQVILELLGGI